MDWRTRPTYVCKHLGLLLVAMQGEDGQWRWDVSGHVGGDRVSVHGVTPLPSLALAKNAAAVAAARLVRMTDRPAP